MQSSPARWKRGWRTGALWWRVFRVGFRLLGFGVLGVSGLGVWGFGVSGLGFRRLEFRVLGDWGVTF